MTVSAIRRLPLPACEPPYDDEVDGRLQRSRSDASPSGAVQGTLALAFVLPSGVPAAPAVPPGLRLVPEVDAEDALALVEFGPQPTDRRYLPDPRSWAGRFVQALVEVLTGDRPAGQLVRWTNAAVYDDVECLVLSPSRNRREAARGMVRSVHVMEPADGVAEVAALVRHGVRTTAIALRLEGLDGRWQCTALELG